MPVINFLIDLLYPPRCAVCRDIIPVYMPRWLCCVCAPGGFTPIGKPFCEKCGAPLEDGRSVCSRCAGMPYKFESNYALFLYAGKEREIILNLKYHFGPPMMAFVKKMIANAADVSRLSGFDYIIPVPIFKRKERNRGFNQAVLLAKALSDITGVPVLNGVLTRIRHTDAQSGLKFYGRRQNIKGAFALSVKKEKILSKAILIVDDIYTTGSTMDECAGVLLNGGAKSVNGFTFCVTAKNVGDDTDLV